MEQAKSSEAANINLDTGSFDRRTGSGRSWTACTVENAIMLVTSCSASKVCHRHVSQYVKFQGVPEFVSHQFLTSSMISHQLRGKQCAYLPLDNVFSGSVATQLRWGGKLCKHLEIMIFRVWCTKN